MTNEQERERVERILAKHERGEKLTDKEWTILAYSPYGTGVRCASCASGLERSQPVMKLARRQMPAFGKELELMAALFMAVRGCYELWLGSVSIGAWLPVIRSRAYLCGIPRCWDQHPILAGRGRSLSKPSRKIYAGS
jgi:hypothetical protein